MTFRILNTMDFTSWLNRLLLVVFIFCSLDSSKFFGVDSESVSLRRLSPGGDIVEGDEVKLQCDVSGLAAGHITEWGRIYMNTDVTIARNGTSLDQRYELDTIIFDDDDTSGISIQEVLIIKNISKTEISWISCRIKYPESEMMSGGISLISNIYFNVYYFPSANYPVCFPDGPFTVQEGTEQIMSCTSEKGNPSVGVQILPSPATAIYTWMRSENNGTVRIVISLELNESYNGYQFQCKITSEYFQGRSRSCIIGPITVTYMTTESNKDDKTITTTELGSRTDNPDMMTDDITLIPSTDISDCHCCQLCKSMATRIPWLVAFIIILILFIVSFIINICLLIKHRHLKITKEKETNAPKTDPYMELQPREDKNRVYMEPTTATTTTQDTYYQPVEVENDSPEHDYAQPEDNTNTSYEAVRTPQSSADRP